MATSSLSSSASSPKREALGYTLKVLAVTVPFTFLATLAAGVILGVMDDWEYPRPLLLAFAATLGGMVGTAIPTYHGYRNLLDANYEGSSRVDQTRHVTLHLPYDKAFQLCLDSLAVFRSYQILVADQAHGRIEAALMPDAFWKVSVVGIGQRISFRLGSDQESMTYVTVASKAPMRAARTGFGANKRNVSRILAFFESRGLRADVQPDANSF